MTQKEKKGIVFIYIFEPGILKNWLDGFALHRLIQIFFAI